MDGTDSVTTMNGPNPQAACHAKDAQSHLRLAALLGVIAAMQWQQQAWAQATQPETAVEPNPDLSTWSLQGYSSQAQRAELQVSPETNTTSDEVVAVDSDSVDSPFESDPDQATDGLSEEQFAEWAVPGTLPEELNELVDDSSVLPTSTYSDLLSDAAMRTPLQSSDIQWVSDRGTTSDGGAEEASEATAGTGGVLSWWPLAVPLGLGGIALALAGSDEEEEAGDDAGA